ncbi:endonuclease/exonuclease/phosphatase (EEP) superfamily protein YafD [Microbacterium resistens]|uniref:Endonuclease/exonuclease/phosphatase (EEP) superfamily protein YafD n=1 Tax=Microbacterium resistens TaxID=156977 RepID=A0ABU1S7N2_9MICO|nr:endonuclease/exonuclease/phosphatase family protein [Microbacterium resistens]MDR6865530.1 endonuclease/exonuclease/phosphatase (EEP) superfamily protein YafD [Microbacterium resistens]
MFRLLGILFTVLFAIATVVLAWPQFFHLEQTFPITQLVAARGLVVLAYLGILILALLLAIARPLRGFAASIAIVALLGAAASAGVGAVRGVAPSALPEKTAESVRVLAWNTAGEAVAAEEIAQTIVEQKADIVALPETTEAVGEEIAIMLRDQGRPMWVHHVQFRPEVERGPDSWQTTLLISPNLGDYSVIQSSADGSSNTGSVPSAVVMPVDGKGPTVVAVHTVAPRPDDMDGWREDLRWVADQCPGGNVIMAGDFNATVDHMGELGKNGGDLGACLDAASRTGAGALGTWPTSLPSLAGAPIDHVMATAQWRASGSQVLDGNANGSDHRALIAQLEPVR